MRAKLTIHRLAGRWHWVLTIKEWGGFWAVCGPVRSVSVAQAIGWARTRLDRWRDEKLQITP